MIFVRAFFVALLITLLAGVVLLDVYSMDTSPWSQFASSTMQRTGGVPFCEHDRSTRLLRERANSLSDFGFLAVGFYMLVRSFECETRSRSKETILSTMNGIANCGHAMGSWLNHACRCQLGHRLDLTGMWLVISFIVLYSLTRRVQIKTPFFAIVFLVIGYLLWLVSDVYYPESYENREKTLTIFLTVLFLLSEWNQLKSRSITRTQVQLLRLSVITLAVGAICGHLDATKVICSPHSWFQLHAVWHLCAACSIVAVYEYFRCEKALPLTRTDHCA